MPKAKLPATNPEPRPWPDPCPKCGVEAKFRKLCAKCEDAVYVIQHEGTHYMGGGVNEVIPCACARSQVEGENKVVRRHRYERDHKIPHDPNQLYRAHQPAYVTTPEMARKAAENLSKGMSIRQSLLDAGFPERTARMGKKAINGRIRAEMKTMGRKYIQLGRQLTVEDQEMLVRGRLLENVVLGNDKAVQSAKQLGADKRVAMWQPDSQVGMVILQPPPIPKIDHEVPIIETRFQKETAMLEAKSREEEQGPEHEETPPEPEEDEYEEEEKKHHPKP